MLGDLFRVKIRLQWAVIPFFRYSKILGETGKLEILQQMFRKFWISNRLPNRYFPKIDVGSPCHFDVICDLLLGSLSDNEGDGN